MISQKDNEEGKLFVGGKLKDFIQILTLNLEHCGVRWISEMGERKTFQISTKMPSMMLLRW